MRAALAGEKKTWLCVGSFTHLLLFLEGAPRDKWLSDWKLVLGSRGRGARE
jgi:hypothetical protein